MSLSNVSVQRPVATSMVFLGILGFGVAAFANLSVDFLPAMQIPELTIKTVFPHSSPEEVEQYVTNPIESIIRTVAGVKGSSSVSREGVSIVSVRFDWGTNMDYAVPVVREKLDRLWSGLPEEVGRPMILQILPSVEPIITIAIAAASPSEPRDQRSSAGSAQMAALKELVRGSVKRRIEQVNGVARANVVGGLEREIRIELDRHRLGSLRMTGDQVAKALEGASGTLPGGMIRHGQLRYSLRIHGEIRHAREIGEIVVLQTPSGHPVRVRDVASVSDTHTRRLGIARYNNREVVVVEVQKDAGANTVTVSKRVHRVIDELQDENPDLALAIVSDQAEFISAAVNDVEEEIILGSVLVFVVLLLFLGQPRVLLAVGVTIPLSILATFAFMYLLGINLNIMSLAGLALGIGMLGDNTLIVVESLTPQGDEVSDTPGSAAAGRVNVALTASTLTNVAVFLPILFVEGVWSELFRDMAITMTVSLVVSLGVAVILVPMLLSSSSLLPVGVRNASGSTSIPCVVCGVGCIALRLARVPGKLNAWSREGLDRYLTWALDHKAVVLLVVLGVASLSAVLAFSIASSDAPGIDRRRFVVTLMMPGSTTLEAMMGSASGIETNIASLPGVKGVYSLIGMAGETEYQTVHNSARTHGYLEVELIDGREPEEVKQTARALLHATVSQVPGLQYRLTARATTFEQILRPQHDDIMIRVSGEKHRIRDSIAVEYLRLMKEVEGVVDIRSTLGSPPPEYRITINRESAWRFGLSVQEIVDFIMNMLRGKEVAFLNEVDARVTIRLLSENDINLQRLLSSPIRSDKKLIPLQSLVECRQGAGLEEITHERQQRVRLLTANVSGRSVHAAADDLSRIAASLRLPVGYSILVGGRIEDIDESVSGLLLAVVLSLLLIYMILAAEYESLLSPLVIMLTGPLAFTGAILAMVVTGQEYDVMSLAGIVVMIGAVDNDAVLVVDVITVLRNKGVATVDAIRMGMRERLRPILLTTATTVLGILPLMWEGWTGTDLIRALTIPLIGGLITSTVFTLTVVPVVYSWIHAKAAKI